MMRLVCHAHRSFTGQCDTIAWCFIWTRLVPNKASMSDSCGIMLPTCDLLYWSPWVRYTTCWYGTACAEPSCAYQRLVPTRVECRKLEALKKLAPMTNYVTANLILTAAEATTHTACLPLSAVGPWTPSPRLVGQHRGRRTTFHHMMHLHGKFAQIV